MNKSCLAHVSVMMLLAQPTLADDDKTIAELDAVWAELTRTVVEGDFDGMAAAYHADAVLVNAISGTSYPISEAMQGWKTGIDRTRAGEVDASVTFKFTQRLHNETTAHDTGMFYYTAKSLDEDASSAIINFEALLVKKDGQWKIMMEYQKSVATTGQWDAL